MCLSCLKCILLSFFCETHFVTLVKAFFVMPLHFSPLRPKRDTAPCSSTETDWSSAQFDNLNGRLRPALHRSRVRLPVEPALFVFSKTAHGDWGSHHWNASLCAADLLMTIVSFKQLVYSFDGQRSYTST